MKSKILRILGVVTTVAIIASVLVAPISAVSGVTVNLAATDTQIGFVNADYTIFATLASQLLGNAGGTITLPDVGDAVRFTANAATDQVKLTVSAGTVSVVMSGAGTYTAGVIQFSAVAETATVTATALATTVAYTKTVGTIADPVSFADVTVAPTCTAAPGAFALPDGGTAPVDTIVFTAAAATDVVTLTFTTGAATVVFSPAATTGGYVAGVITFDAVGQTATVTGTVNNTAGTWARTAGLATGAPGANGNKLLTVAASVAGGDTITITYPAGFLIAAPTATLSAAPGWVTLPGAVIASFVPSVTTGVVWSFDATARTITAKLAAGDYIGEGAQVRIAITAGVTNTATAGDYTLTVKTSKETTAVASNTFTIVNPTPAALPGVVTVYNASNVAIFNSNANNAIALSLGQVLGTGWTITLTPGTYAEGTLTIPVGLTGLTVKGVGDIATIIVGGNWVVNAGNVTFSNMTMLPGTASLTAVSVGATGGGIKIDSCSFVRSGTAASLNDQFSISYAATTIGATTTAATGMISNNKFDSTLGGGFDVSVAVATGSVGLTISKNTFNSDYTNPGHALFAYWEDISIQPYASCTIDSNTFTGAGWGVDAEAGTVVVTNNTFTGIHMALNVGAWSAPGTATVTFDSNTLTNVGASTTAWPPNGTDAMTVTKNGTVKIINNSIKGAGNYVLTVAAAATPANMAFMYNTIDAGNKYGVKNLNAVSVNATHNFWGAATGPVTGYNTAGVDASGFLGKAANAGAKVFMLPTAAVTDATIGATVTNITANYIGLAAYAANPVAINVPATVTASSYLDVTVNGGAVNTTIRIAGTTAAPVTTASGVMILDPVFGQWTAVPGVIQNVFGNYMEFTIATSSLGGSPFAVVATKPTVPGAVPAIVPPYMPITGTTGFPVDGTFSWAPVAGAIGYDVVVAEDSTLADKFAVINYSASTTINASPIPADQTLKYDTVYWWRVRATNAVGPGVWTVGFFTTEKAPVVPTQGTTTVITTTIPVVTSVAPPNITLEVPVQEPVNVIPPFLLWAVVAVGVILIIAVIVLIVRTRRIS